MKTKLKCLLVFFAVASVSSIYAQGRSSAGDATLGVFLLLTMVFAVLVPILILGSLWILYAKAKRPGWAVFVPVYSIIVGLDIAGKPGWWFLLFLIPIVNLFFIISSLIGFARAYGKSGLYALGLLPPFLLLFLPILAATGRYDEKNL